jgi:hypothetical protein
MPVLFSAPVKSCDLTKQDPAEIKIGNGGDRDRILEEIMSERGLCSVVHSPHLELKSCLVRQAGTYKTKTRAEILWLIYPNVPKMGLSFGRVSAAVGLIGHDESQCPGCFSTHIDLKDGEAQDCM